MVPSPEARPDHERRVALALLALEAAAKNAHRAVPGTVAARPRLNSEPVPWWQGSMVND